MPAAAASPPPVSWGQTSTLGVVLAIVGAAGTLSAAVAENDMATAVSAGLLIVAAVATLAGRYAQAYALAKAGRGPAVDTTAQTAIAGMQAAMYALTDSVSPEVASRLAGLVEPEVAERIAQPQRVFYGNSGGGLTFGTMKAGRRGPVDASEAYRASDDAFTGEDAHEPGEGQWMGGVGLPSDVTAPLDFGPNEDASPEPVEPAPDPQPGEVALADDADDDGRDDEQEPIA